MGSLGRVCNTCNKRFKDGNVCPACGSPRLSWQVRYRDPNGRLRGRSFTRKGDASAFASTTDVALRRGEWTDPRLARVTFRQWQEQWKATTTNLRPSSRARDDAYLRNYILPVFGGMRLGTITQLDMRGWVSDLAAAGYAPATIHKAYQTACKILQAAVDAQMIPASPCRNVPLPRVEVEEMRFLTTVDVARLANTITPRYRAMVFVAANCGLRLSELAGLRRHRVDTFHRKLWVAEQAVEVRGHMMVGPPKTKAGRREVPIPARVADELAGHLREHCDSAPDALVFPGRDGGMLRAGQWRRRHWMPATVAAGLGTVTATVDGAGKEHVHYGGLRPHDLRHTAVALWIAAGASPKQIATWAGHTSVSVVLDRYGHLFQGHELEAVGRLDAMFVADAPAATILPLDATFLPQDGGNMGAAKGNGR